MSNAGNVFGFKHGIFDLDGTLVDSVAYCQKIFAELAGTRGIPEAEAHAFYASTTGSPLHEQFKKMLHMKGLLYTEAELEALRQEFNEMFIKYEVAFFPGARLLVHNLSAAGLRLFVSSASSDETVAKRVRDGRLGSYFDLAFGSTALPKGSAHLEAFARHLDILPSEFAMDAFLAGDGERDMEIAVSAGLYPIGVAGTVSADRLYSAGAKRVVLQISDLLLDLKPNDP